MTSIQRKLMLALVPVAIFFVLQGLLVWFMGGQTTDNVSNTVRKNTTASAQLGELSVLAQQIRRYEKEYFVYVADQKKRDGYIKDWAGTAEKINKALTNMMANSDKAYSAQETVEIGKWKDSADFYGAEMKKIFSAVGFRSDQLEKAPVAPSVSDASAKKSPAAQGAEAVVMYTPVEANVMITAGKDRLAAELIRGAAAMSKAKSEQTLALPAIAEKGFQNLLIGALVTVALGVLLTVYVIYTLPAAIKAPVQALTASVDAISKGNVGNPAASVGVQEFTTLEQGIERLRQSQKLMLERMGKKFA